MVLFNKIFPSNSNNFTAPEDVDLKKYDFNTIAEVLKV